MKVNKKFLVELNLDNFSSLQRKKGWNESETADQIKISTEQLWKVKKGIHKPGTDFIAGTLAAFPEINFDDVFIIPNSLRVRKV